MHAGVLIFWTDGIGVMYVSIAFGTMGLTIGGRGMCCTPAERMGVVILYTLRESTSSDYLSILEMRSS
jgi:hypothetical protein